MFQHRLHDAVGTFAVLGDLLQVAGQRGGDVLDLCALLVGQPGEARRGSFLQLVNRSTDRAAKLLTKFSGFLISWAMPAVS